MTPTDRLAANRSAFDAAFARCPVIAILRGLVPAESVAVGEALVAAGVRLIEVPLNRPDALSAIGRLSDAIGTRAVIGAGTVLTAIEAERAAARGARFMVAPNTDAEAMAAAGRAGLVRLPGVFTPSEAFSALKAGADALKLFPAEGLSPPVVKAMRAVLPRETRLIAVGGVGTDDIGRWRAAGIDGLGVGSALFTPGVEAAEVARRAAALLAAWGAA